MEACLYKQNKTSCGTARKRAFRRLGDGHQLDVYFQGTVHLSPPLACASLPAQAFLIGASLPLYRPVACGAVLPPYRHAIAYASLPA